MAPQPIIVWFRQDLRLADHPALAAAAATGRAVLPVYCHAPDEERGWPPGGAARWWLAGSLRSLDADLRRIGSRLLLRSGAADVQLAELAHATGAREVYCSRRYEPAALEQESRVEQSLARRQVSLRRFAGSLLCEPEAVRNRQGSPFRVFTPFWRHLQSLELSAAPLAAPRQLAAPDRWPAGVTIDALRLLPTIDWAAGMRAHWQPGAAGAQERLARFVRQGLGQYAELRDRADLDFTSSLSPHLHWGELSPRQVWHAIVGEGRTGAGQPGEAYLRQLAWREFGYHLLFHFPHTEREPLDANFVRFPWRDDPAALRAWQRGQTGFPIVDAGMRQLWSLGWMHNRLRLIVASFLVKDLLLPWQAGAEWFWDTLVDADLANNTLGWQWTAGCGADAAPYFRVFNPLTQARRFDPDGVLVRRWVPELAGLPDEWLQNPWEAPPLLLADAGVRLGTDYPRPLVDHEAARQRALAALATMKAARPSGPRRSRG